jgi:hypothetical protein
MKKEGRKGKMWTTERKKELTEKEASIVPQPRQRRPNANASARLCARRQHAVAAPSRPVPTC